MIILLAIIAVLLAINIVVSYSNADSIATAILVSSGAKAPPKPTFNPSKPTKETDEQRRERILLENIEAYDGTSKGQVKI
jgi:hypothetical protein